MLEEKKTFYSGSVLLLNMDELLVVKSVIVIVLFPNNTQVPFLLRKTATWRENFKAVLNLVSPLMNCKKRLEF